MSEILDDICRETGVDILDTRLQHKRGPGQTCAHGTLLQILADEGSAHLRSVLLTVMDSENNKMALVRPVLLAVSDLLVANPTWFGGKWLEVFDEIDLCALYEETRAHRPRVPSRHVLFGMILERLRPHFAEGKLL